MAFSIQKRITLLDHLRSYIGDEDKPFMFSDAQLNSILRGCVFPALRTETLTATNNYYYSYISRPVIDMEITSGTSDAIYTLDESVKQVQWSSGTAAPANNHTIEVSYLDVDFYGAVQEALTRIATDRSKLAVKSDVGGIKTDTTVLRRELMKQVQSLAAIQYWRQI